MSAYTDPTAVQNDRYVDTLPQVYSQICPCIRANLIDDAVENYQKDSKRALKEQKMGVAYKERNRGFVKPIPGTRRLRETYMAVPANDNLSKSPGDFPTWVKPYNMCSMSSYAIDPFYSFHKNSTLPANVDAEYYKNKFRIPDRQRTKIWESASSLSLSGALEESGVSGVSGVSNQPIKLRCEYGGREFGPVSSYEIQVDQDLLSLCNPLRDEILNSMRHKGSTAPSYTVLLEGSDPASMACFYELVSKNEMSMDLKTSHYIRMGIESLFRLTYCLDKYYPKMVGVNKIYKKAYKDCLKEAKTIKDYLRCKDICTYIGKTNKIKECVLVDMLCVYLNYALGKLTADGFNKELDHKLREKIYEGSTPRRFSEDIDSLKEGVIKQLLVDLENREKAQRRDVRYGVEESPESIRWYATALKGGCFLDVS
jgi:hypothetical protein